MSLIDAVISRIDKLIRERLDASILSRLASDDPRLNALNATINSRLSSEDARLNYLNASLNSRLASNDSRLNYLDGSILSRLANNDVRLNYLNASIASRREDKGQKAKSYRAEVSTTVDMTHTINGSGFLTAFVWQGVTSSARISYINISVDGQPAEQVAALNYDGRTYIGGDSILPSGHIPINIRFKTSCAIVARAQGNNIYLNTLYSLDI